LALSKFKKHISQKNHYQRYKDGKLTKRKETIKAITTTITITTLAISLSETATKRKEIKRCNDLPMIQSCYESCFSFSSLLLLLLFSKLMTLNGRFLFFSIEM